MSCSLLAFFFLSFLFLCFYRDSLSAMNQDGDVPTSPFDARMSEFTQDYATRKSKFNEDMSRELGGRRDEAVRAAEAETAAGTQSEQQRKLKKRLQAVDSQWSEDRLRGVEDFKAKSLERSKVLCGTVMNAAALDTQGKLPANTETRDERLARLHELMIEELGPDVFKPSYPHTASAVMKDLPRRAHRVELFIQGQPARLDVPQAHAARLEDAKAEMQNLDTDSEIARPDVEFDQNGPDGKEVQPIFNVDGPRITREEARAALRKLDATGEDRPHSTNEDLAAWVWSAAMGIGDDPDTQDYYKRLLSSVDDQSGYKDILAGYGPAVGFVCIEDGMPFGYSYPTLFADGIPVGGWEGRHSAYPTWRLIGLGSIKPSLHELSDLYKIGRVFLMPLWLLVAELATDGGYVKDSAQHNMFMGICLEGGGLRTVNPIRLVFPFNGEWERVFTLRPSPGGKEVGECLELFLLVILLGCCLRGWMRMAAITGPGFFVTVGPCFSVEAPGCERRLEVCQQVTEKIWLKASEVASVAASRELDSKLREAVGACAIAGRANTLCIEAATLADEYEGVILASLGPPQYQQDLLESRDGFHEAHRFVWNARRVLEETIHKLTYQTSGGLD